MMIIPAIDIFDGKCVRLIQGDFGKSKTYSDNPLEVACELESVGIKRIHFVDLEGAKAGKIKNSKILHQVATKTNLQIDFGGGIRTNEDIEEAFNCGASQVTGGSVSIQDRELFLSWVEKYGSEKIILGADVRNKLISISGWQEKTQVPLETFLDFYQTEGIKYCICTDIDLDGMMERPNFSLYKDLISSYPSLEIIASGGVSSLEDIHLLREIGVYGVILGKAIYEKRISIKDLGKLIC